MNYRQNAIDTFLKYWRDIAAYNPNINITSNAIYQTLIQYGVPKEKGGSIEDKFNKWISRFSGHSKINVFVSENWKYFCQFVSKDTRARQATDHYKVYVPLDKDHIEEGANQLFDFLSQNNISHVSKIGKVVRFDDIVIRLSNQTEFLKVMNYVTNNRYLQEGMIPANPFAASFNNIAVACDGRISYNSTVSSLISLYINSRKRNRNLNQVDTNDFYGFVMEYYNKNFINEPDYERLTKDFCDRGDVINTPEQVVNYMNVINLILKTSNPEFSIMNYLSHYNECTNPQLQQGKVEFITEKMKANQARKEQQNAVLNLTFINAIETMTERTKSRSKAIDAIGEYLRTGNATLLTRQNNLRSNICNSNFRDDLNNYLTSNNISYSDYVSKVLPPEKKQEQTSQQEEVNLDIELLRELVEVMEEKYGMNTTLNNLRDYLRTGSTDKITRTNNLRARVCNSSFRDDLNRVLNEKGITLEDCISLARSQKQRTKEDYLQDALLATYSKYDKLYRQGQSEHSGVEFISGSLSKLVMRNKYDGFTRENGVRQNLERNVTPEDAIAIMRERLNIKDGYTSGLEKDELTTLMSQYVCFIVNSQAFSMSH